MASLHDITVGQDIEFKRILSRAGFDAAAVHRIIKEPSLAERMYASFREPAVEVGPRTFLFTSPDEQITLVRAWNKERGWGFTEEDFEKLGPAPTPPDDPLVTVVLVPYLPDLPKKGKKEGVPGYLRTFHELWKLAASRQEKSWLWDGYDNADEKRIKLLSTEGGSASGGDGIEHAPGLRWEVLDLGANRGKAPTDVRNPKTSPHAGILAAAALHPAWVQSMDGDTVPYVWLPGYVVSVPGEGRWSFVSNLWFGRAHREVRLGADRDNRDPEYAVPAPRE